VHHSSSSSRAAKIFYDYRFAQDDWNCRFSIADCRLSIADLRLPIAPPRWADGHWKELPHHFFNRQSAISPPRRGNESMSKWFNESMNQWPNSLRS